MCIFQKETEALTGNFPKILKTIFYKIDNKFYSQKRYFRNQIFFRSNFFLWDFVSLITHTTKK